MLNISEHGFWMLVGGRERFLGFEHFPWFRKARVEQIFQVELVGREHLRWPALDVDLSLESIEHPERFPLVSEVRERPRAARRSHRSGTPRSNKARRSRRVR